LSSAHVFAVVVSFSLSLSLFFFFFVNLQEFLGALIPNWFYTLKTSFPNAICQVS
jgi:hypothetical protein